MESFKKNTKKATKCKNSNNSKQEETKESKNHCNEPKDTKTVKVIYDSQLSIKLTIKKSEQESLTCHWLMQEVLRNLQSVSKQKDLKRDFSSFIKLKTQNKNIQLDYWLSLPDKSIAPLPHNITLLPVHSITNDRKGPVSQKDFEILTILAEGGSCDVFIARKKDNGKIYAIKRIGKKALSNFEKTSIAVRRELSCLRKLTSNFIVKLHYTYQTNHFYYFVLDYLPGGDLFYYLTNKKKFSEAVAKYYVAEILIALKEVHSQNIIYRDLKPENVLVDIDGHAILADFGLSKEVEDLRSLNNSHVGTPEYMAPELAGRRDYNYMVDFYGLGAVAYELVAGKTPFVCKSTDNGSFDENVQKKLPPIPAKFSPEFKEFLLKLLEKDPAKRLGSEGGADEVMAHPWLAEIDFAKLANKEIQPPIQVEMNKLNLVLTELDLQRECEVDEEDPKAGRGVRNLSQFSFSEDIAKEITLSESDQTEETNDMPSEEESTSLADSNDLGSLSTISSKRIEASNINEEVNATPSKFTNILESFNSFPCIKENGDFEINYKVSMFELKQVNDVN